MPDRRSHRGPHPEDAALFAPRWHPALRSATGDLSWLLSRGYAAPSATKIVGDRYALDARQRTAVMRCACPDAACAGRLSRELPIERWRGRRLLIDGYNVLTTVEAALGGGVVLHARDGSFRDIASMHGSFRKVEETVPALHLVGRTLAEAGVERCVWYLDQPVSNSGRLKGVITEIARDQGWPWDVQLVVSPDAVLSAAREELIASADSVILDACGAWANVAREVVMRHVPDAAIVDLSG
jgi:hypothetical protein